MFLTLCINFIKGRGQKISFCTLLLPGNVKKKRKKIVSFFIDHVFVGVFQYDPGPPKHALELRTM